MSLNLKQKEDRVEGSEAIITLCRRPGDYKAHIRDWALVKYHAEVTTKYADIPLAAYLHQVHSLLTDQKLFTYGTELCLFCYFEESWFYPLIFGSMIYCTKFWLLSAIQSKSTGNDAVDDPNQERPTIRNCEVWPH